jgi:hypothetical protein
MKRIQRGAIVAVATLFLCAGFVRAQVLDQVPSNALVVLKVNNLKATSDKIAKLAQDLGIAAFLPAAGDPLGALQVETKMQKGIDLSGEMAFVMLDPDKVGGDAEKAMMILVPISDFPAFLSNWPDATTENGVSQVKLGDAGEPGFVANWGKYAVLAPTREAVANKPAAGLKAPSVTAKQLAEKDVIFYANFEALRPKMTPVVQMGRAQAAQQLQGAIGNAPQAAKFGPVISALADQLFNGIDRFVAETQASSIGLSFAPEGLTATVMAEFAPNSYLATNVASIKNSDASMLSGLPQGKYIFYGGTSSDPAAMSKLVSDVGDPILQKLLAIGPEMAAAKDYFDALKAYVAANRGQTFGFLAPSGQIGTVPLLQFVSIQNGDAQALMSAYSKMIQSQAAMMKALAIPGADATAPMHTAAAKTVDGVKFDTFVTKVDANAADPMVRQQAQMLQMMYGPSGMVLNVGAIDPQKMLMTSGVPDQFISSAITAAKANNSPVASAEALKGVTSQLPKQRVAEMYLSLGELATTGLAYARQLGLAIPVQLPPDLPPIGMTIATENNTATRFDVHVPTTLIQSLIAAGMQAQMQMQGGGGAGGGL